MTLVRIARERTMRRTILLVTLTTALTLSEHPVAVGAPIYHGELRVARAGKGRLNLDSGQASFRVRDWELLPSDDSNGIDPANEPIVIGIAEEQFLLPAGVIRSSRNGKRFSYKNKSDRGIGRLVLRRTSTGSFKVSMTLNGVDLSVLVIADPPLCLSFALIIGDDDGFTGVSFDRPKPYPSKRLTIPSFCTDNSDWPWA